MTKDVTDFYRIKRLPPYVFAEVNRLKAEYRAKGRDIIDLGMGNPDSAPPQHIIDKLKVTADDPTAHGYSMSRGIPGLRKAQCGYYKRRFDVDLDPEKEMVVTLGSKEGLANLLQAIVAPGDVIMVPNPSYPIHPFGAIICGASVWNIQRAPDDEFVEDVKRAIKHCAPKPTAIILNYPCNPTTTCVPLKFYQDVVDLCRKEGIWVISDLAYCELYYDDNPPPSILEAEGAMDIAIEFTTVSKTYSMAGWRIGFAAGNRTLISALTRVKSYLDYGAFTPIQVAAAAAINGPQDYVDEMRAMYKERRDVLVEGLRAAGWDVPSPSASMFIWAPLPEQYKHIGSFAFSQLLMNKAGVAVAPGVGFGEHGDGFVRIALVENKQRLRQAIRSIKQFLAEDPAKVLAEEGMAA